MAVELHAVAALAYVPVRVYKTGAHFQLLINVHEPEPVFFQLCLPLSGGKLPPLYARGFLQHSPQLRQLHKSHLVLLLILCIF